MAVYLDDLPRGQDEEKLVPEVQRNQKKVRELPISYLQDGIRCAIKYDNQLYVEGGVMKEWKAMQRDVQL